MVNYSVIQLPSSSRPFPVDVCVHGLYFLQAKAEKPTTLPIKVRENILYEMTAEGIALLDEIGMDWEPPLSKHKPY